LSEKLKVALLGFGQAAQYLHLPVLTGLSQVELVAIAEPRSACKEAAKAACPAVAVFESYQTLLSETDPDAVVIALPNDLHVPAAKAAFARKKHVYLEKPIATSLAEARSLIPTWRASGRVGMIGHNYRFGMMQQSAHSAIAAKSIGEIITLQTVFSGNAHALPDWKRERATGGGALLDLASHHFDLVCWLVDSLPATVSCCLRSMSSEDDTAIVQLQFENGVTAQIMASLCAGDNDRLEVYGTKGRLVIDRYRSDRVEVHPKSLNRVRALRFANAAKALASPSYWRGKLPGAGPENSFWCALDEFATAALENRSTKPDLIDGLRSLSLVAAAEEAAAQGCEVRIRPMDLEERTGDESPVG